MSDVNAELLPLADAVTEGWSYRPATNPVKQVIMRAVAPSVKGLAWGRLLSDKPLSLDVLIALLRQASFEAASGLVISFSHDDYINVGGGVQNVVGDEQAALQERGWAYFHVCPNEPKPSLGRLTPAGETHYIANLNGQRIGVVAASDMLHAVQTLRGESIVLRCIVHHLLGFSPEHVALVIRECGADYPPFVWIHDTFTLCPSVAMLRNEAVFCGGPAVRSAVCSICHAGLERVDHVARVARFFQELQPVILAPSETILEFWVSRGRYMFKDAHVLPLCKIEFKHKVSDFDAKRPLRVAFFGSAFFHKGWDTFEALARWHADDSRYEFFHLGAGVVPVPGVRFVPTLVTRSNRSAMVESSIASSIDVAVNWSRCYESFSFTAHEALAAGAFLLAPRGAGHLDRLLSKEYPDLGCLVGSDVELSALFEEDGLLERVARSPRQSGKLLYGRGAGELLRMEPVYG